MDVRILTIIMPCYNEVLLLPKVFEKLSRLVIPNWQFEVIVVDDASTDQSLSWLTSRVSEFPWLTILRHEQNKGKGAAVRTGIDRALGEYTIILDADGEYDPFDIKMLMAALPQGEVVYGKRSLHVNWHGYWFFILGNACMNAVMSVCSGQNIEDAYTGFKLLKTEQWKKLAIVSQGFALEAEITAKLLRAGRRIIFVPITYAPRTFRQGKKITLQDGFIGLWVFLKIFFTRA